MIYQSFIRVKELVADRPGHRFEREVAGLFQRLGWEIRLTPVTGVLGADVVV